MSTPQDPGGAGQRPYDQQPHGPSPYGQQQPYGPSPYPQQPGYPPAYPPPGWAPVPYAMPVERHVGWFVVNWLFFWPLAVYSLVSAYQGIDRALAHGDVVGARYHAERVKKLGIIGLCIGLGWTLLWFIFVVAVAASEPGCSLFC